MLSAGKLLSLINSLGGIVWEADAETFQFTFVSQEAERILGFPPHEWLDDPQFWSRHSHPDDVERVAKDCVAASREGRDHEFEYRMIAADGRVVWLRDIVSVVQAPGSPTRLVGIMLDITAQKRELEDAQPQLAQAMKMEAVGRLAGGVAHDFNNLLTVIAGYAELVSASLEKADPRSEDLAEIKRAAHRASLLTRQLLTFSRKQVVHPEVLDLNAVVTEVGVLIRRLIGEDIQLAIQTCEGDVPVYADRSQLEQVLMNLAVNARDAMPLGGRLVIATALIASGVKLTVSDTGSGMSPEVAARIFEPFFTTKEMGKGTGLGLSTAYGIVKQSGGDIQVTSEPGKGSCFAISLPVARPADEAETADMPRGDETILLVEDEEQVRSLVEQVLTRLGYTVLTAPDGLVAMEICKSRRRDIALLLTDIVMAQISGPQVYARVAELIPGIAVLYMSGYAGDTVFARGVRAGEVPFLQKPFTPVAVARKVREVLDRGPGRSRGASGGSEFSAV
jgi:two-component system, cell cycle sensor histidine kinase and response regulator CckA